MSLSDLSAVASLISSICVAISVIYLALQVRQGERNQRAMMQQGRATRASDAAFNLAQPDFAVIFNKAARNPKDLSPEELDRFILMSRAAFLSAEDSVLQYKAGLLEETAYRSFVAGVYGLVGRSIGLRAAWRLNAHQYGPDLAAIMTEALKRRIAPSQDVQARWNAVVDAEIAATPAESEPHQSSRNASGSNSPSV